MVVNYDDGILRMGDCLELMKDIPDGSVDMVLCDLPYGTTRNKWDEVIPLDKLWEQYNRIVKENGAVVLFGAQPFSTDLINSNRKFFRYEWVWNKKTITGFLNANRMPLKVHELLLVFYRKLPTYNPQFWQSTPYNGMKKGLSQSTNYEKDIEGFVRKDSDGKRHPIDIIEFAQGRSGQHPTQKPVQICEYMIKTYTNKGDVVLDCCMGSGTTPVACVNTNRRFIGIEKEQKYFDLAVDRVNSAIELKEVKGDGDDA